MKNYSLDTEKVLNKIIERNFPSLKKKMAFRVPGEYKTPNRLDKKRNSPWNIIIKIKKNTCSKERKQEVSRKYQVIHKGRPFRIIPEVSKETLKARKAWTDSVQQTLSGHRCQPRLLYPVCRLYVIVPHMFIGNGIIKRYGFVGVGTAIVG